MRAITDIGLNLNHRNNGPRHRCGSSTVAKKTAGRHSTQCCLASRTTSILYHSFKNCAFSMTSVGIIPTLCFASRSARGNGRDVCDSSSSMSCAPVPAFSRYSLAQLSSSLHPPDSQIMSMASRQSDHRIALILKISPICKACPFCSGSSYAGICEVLLKMNRRSLLPHEWMNATTFSHDFEAFLDTSFSS